MYVKPNVSIKRMIWSRLSDLTRSVVTAVCAAPFVAVGEAAFAAAGAIVLGKLFVLTAWLPYW